jgi:protein tyrosine phosphatase (PTP) superfamily phosphohydrolase (DUF442 family)
MNPLHLALPAVLALGAVLFTPSCRSGGTSSADTTHAHAAVQVPAIDAGKAADLPGLHNVVTYAPDVVGGGQPEGREGLATLQAMGIKTVISVDGQKPDVELAAKLGLRYVHLPISYDTITKDRQQELAQAIASCEGPIYLHCHHGKHRSAAALGSALVLCGTLTPEVAQQRMKVSGTAKEYTGLWQAVANGKPMDATRLKVDPKSFPSIATVSGMVATMAEIDAVIDLVKQSHQAGWKAPSDHPDLVATKETARLATLFAGLRDDAESKALPADYQRMLGLAIDQSLALDNAVRGGDSKQAEAMLASLNKGCKECHVLYRDK